MSRELMQEIETRLSALPDLYDAIRLVDPIAKQVICWQGEGLSHGEPCHGFWPGGVCDNCISIRAHLERRSYMKLEQNQDGLYLVQAVPMMAAGRPLVLELLKNANETMLIDGGMASADSFQAYIRQINELIARDHLTGLYNRRFVDERLPVDMVLAQEAGLPLALCFVDMDDLTRLNNRYGHAAGDQAIKAVGRTLGSQIRAGRDWAARYGGDEFLICLHNTDAAQAAQVAARLQAAVAAAPLCLAEGPTDISVSCGVASLGPDIANSQALISAADRDMYAAKRQKRPYRYPPVNT